MIFTIEPIPYQPQTTYHQQILNIKEDCTFMGVTLDIILKFNKRIQIIGKKKTGRSIGIIYKLKKFVPFNTHRNLYYTLIYPYLFYCKIMW